MKTIYHKLMRILYVGMKFDYGNPDQGYSFEHCNFYETLANMGHDILYFDFLSLFQTNGKEWMNRRLWDVATSEKPDLMFTVLYQDQLDPRVIDMISQSSHTTTLNWFCDDHWRFDNFSRYWAPCFNWVTTTANSALPKYQAIGYDSVIKTQWACNHYSYKNLGIPTDFEVTFVGMPHGNRPQVLDYVYRSGIDIRVWGQGWSTGRLTQEEMIRTFNRSKVNLNLSNASTPNIEMGRHEYAEQIKGRNFEVPGCGGFLLTGPADNLDDYYENEKEIVRFDGHDDLVDKIKYYLAHEDERLAIAKAGYERTLRDHTYERRFKEIFEKMGLGATANKARKKTAGETIYITQQDEA